MREKRPTVRVRIRTWLLVFLLLLFLFLTFLESPCNAAFHAASFIPQTQMQMQMQRQRQRQRQRRGMQHARQRRCISISYFGSHFSSTSPLPPALPPAISRLSLASSQSKDNLSSTSTSTSTPYEKDEMDEKQKAVASPKQQQLKQLQLKQQQEQEAPRRPYVVPHDDSNVHLSIVVAGTFWWYAYAFLAMWHHPQFGMDMDLFLYRCLALFIPLSQLAVYAGCYQLARATTLRQAQALVVGMTALCVPADVIVTLVNPTGSKANTILAFCEITLFFGTYLAHYLRKASYRECPPSKPIVNITQTPISRSNAIEIPIDDDDDSQEIQDMRPQNQQEYDGGDTNRNNTIFDTLVQYRPPQGMQATAMAVEFTRSFVAFTIAAGSVGELIANDPTIYKDQPVVIGSLLVVVLHTALECTLVTVFPGVNSQLQRYVTFEVTEITLYAVHLLAASVATIQTSVFSEGGLVNQALFIWLFGSATAKVIFKLAALLGKVNWDAKLGLSDLDQGA